MKKWIHKILPLACTTALIFVPQTHAQTSTWVIDTNHSQAAFQVRHLAVSTVRGSLSGAKGTVSLDEKDITRSKIEATLSTATVNTNNERRDADLRSSNFFDVEKYPVLIFRSTAITNIGGTLKMAGDLTLGGKTKSVTLNVDGPSAPQKGQNGKMVSGFSATGTIKRSDFNFAPKPQYSGVIGDEVKLTIDIEIDKQ